MTVKGLDCLRHADVVIYDRLVDESILQEGRSDAEKIYVGKASKHHTLEQEMINHLLVQKAREGKVAVRLKGGDPFVLGRGGEEAEALVENGIPFDYSDDYEEEEYDEDEDDLDDFEEEEEEE